jgi:hypothetical protein
LDFFYKFLDFSYIHKLIGLLKCRRKRIGGKKMTYSFKVENKFEMAQRDIHVIRKNLEETLEEHRLSCPVYGEGEEETKAVALSLGTVEEQEDYLEISVDNDQVELGPCKIDLPAEVPFTFIPAGSASITVVPAGNGSTSLKIPSGLPGWKLALMKPTQLAEPMSREAGIENVPDIMESAPTEPNVTVGDDGPGGED